jgi:hypothetical protein
VCLCARLGAITSRPVRVDYHVKSLEFSVLRILSQLYGSSDIGKPHPRSSFLEVRRANEKYPKPNTRRDDEKIMMNEYENFPDHSSSQQELEGRSWQTSSPHQGTHNLSSVIDPRLYDDLYSADTPAGQDVSAVDFDDISGESSIDQSSGGDDSSW